MDEYLIRARAMEEELRTLRRSLHRCPELGFKLPETIEIVKSKLAELGCEVITLGGGMTAELGGVRPGPTLLLRADMDALPMKEESGLEFASSNGAAHACGHDLHTTMLLGAVRLLKAREHKLRGKIRLMFQSAEETASGARAMLEHGVLEGVDAAFAMHVATQRPVGLLNCTHGPKTASYDRFGITITGKGGHGAFPHQAADPINAAVHLYLALQELVSHECPPEETAVLTIGMFQAGTAGNVIPDSVYLEGTARAASRECRELLRRRLKEQAQGICGVYRTAAVVEMLSEVPPLYNDPDLTRRMAAFARVVLGEALVSEKPEPLTASEDFALIAERVPTAYLTMGTGREEDGYLYGNHNSRVCYDEGVLSLGAAVFARCAENFLDEMKKEPDRG